MRLARVACLALAWLAILTGPAWPADECLTTPNANVAAFPTQSKYWSQDIRIQAEGTMQTGVVFAPGACLCTPQGSPNMTVAVAGCTIAQHGSTATVTSGNVTISAAHATLNRIDWVSADNTGTKIVTTGTAAASPAPPTLPTSGGFLNVSLCQVYVPAADTAINANQIVDKRACIPTPGGGGGGASTAEPFITKTATGGLSNEFALGSLSTGLLVNTVTTGIPTVLVPTDDNIAVGNGTVWQLKALPTCSGGTNALTYNISTNAFGCNTLGGSTPTGTGFTHITAGAQDAAAKLVDTADINAAQVTYAKLQNVSAASLLLGRGSAAGAGVPQEIIVGSGLTMTGTTLSASAGGGNVSNVGTPTSGQIAQWTTATTIQGTTGLTYDAAAGALISATTGPHQLEISDAGTTTVTATRIKHTTSGVMADGFGSSMNLVLRDNSAVDNVVGAVRVTRSGADNTGALGIQTAIAGSVADRIAIDATGAVTVQDLAGTGTRMVTASAAGLLATAAIPGGSGATMTTFASALPADQTVTLPHNSQTTRAVTYFFLPGSITVNQLSIYFSGITTAGNFKLCLYTENGATKVVDITITPASGVVTGAVGAIVVAAGGYYAAAGCGSSACNVVSVAALSGTTTTLFGSGTPAGKNPWSGTVTHTSGTCNTTLGTVTGTGAGAAILAIRGDN